jgi:anti-sigma B factor antagonist
MNITTRFDDGIAVISIEGEIDGKTAPEAQKILLPILAEHSKVVMDLGKVTYMSSAGLRTMLLVYRSAKAKNGSVSLVNLLEPIRETMDATGFLGFFTISTDVASAIAALKA